jgi:prepilin-type N-terminal cleavage/methylation domain-containing protein
MKSFPSSRSGFTLIELLTVIAIIAVLMGLLFPAISSVKETARKTQAKNDVMQIVNAVKSYYAEYGKYPGDAGSDTTYNSNNNDLFNVLRAKETGSDLENPRQIVFMEVPPVKDAATPRGGINSSGVFYDPWGTPYRVILDTDYNNTIANPYSGGNSNIDSGVLVLSLGKDKAGGTGTKGTGVAEDDVTSW